MRIYHVAGTRSTRILWALEEIGAPYEVTRVTDRRTSEEHLQRHPLGRVPVVEFDDGTLLYESGAICLQLADLNPDAGLIPPVGSTERGLVYQWTFFGVTQIEPVAFPWHRAHREDRDETEQAAAFEPVGAALRRNLAEHPWIVGDSFTVADIMCASILGNTRRLGLLTDDDPISEYVDRALARPAQRRAEAVDE
jgi:glutathione S-transferase